MNLVERKRRMNLDAANYLGTPNNLSLIEKQDTDEFDSEEDDPFTRQ